MGDKTSRFATDRPAPEPVPPVVKAQPTANTSPASTQRLLNLQRTIGNRAVVKMLQPVGPSIQRLWDVDEFATAEAGNYALLLGRMEGLTPIIGKSRLGRFAGKTTSAKQLFDLLALGVSDLELYLGVYEADTLERLSKLAPVPALKSLLNVLVRFPVDLNGFLDDNPAPTALQIKNLQLDGKRAQRVISAKGDEILWTTVAGVSGDGVLGEKAAVLAAVKALDKGELVGSAHGNRQGNLPRYVGETYTEYDVAPPTSVRNRGERRLVVNNTKKFVYYTWNHYGGPSGLIVPCYKRIR